MTSKTQHVSRTGKISSEDIRQAEAIIASERTEASKPLKAEERIIDAAATGSIPQSVVAEAQRHLEVRDSDSPSGK